jgi:hypothetical protein
VRRRGPGDVLVGGEVGELYGGGCPVCGVRMPKGRTRRGAVAAFRFLAVAFIPMSRAAARFLDARP